MKMATKFYFSAFETLKSLLHGVWCHFLIYFSIIHVKRFLLYNGRCCEVNMEKLGNLMCANAFIQEAALIYQEM